MTLSSRTPSEIKREEKRSLPRDSGGPGIRSPHYTVRDSRQINFETTGKKEPKKVQKIRQGPPWEMRMNGKPKGEKLRTAEKTRRVQHRQSRKRKERKPSRGKGCEGRKKKTNGGGEEKGEKRKSGKKVSSKTRQK